MDELKFKELQEFTKNKFKITEENVLSQSISIPSSYHYFLSLYADELKIYKNKITEKEKLYGILYNSIRFDNKTTSNKGLKNLTEIEPYINSNEIYYQLCIDINHQEMVVKYLEETLSSINKLSYAIKNYIDIKNFRANNGNNAE